MKKTLLVVVLALVLMTVFATSAYATTAKMYAYGTSYYTWLTPAGITLPSDPPTTSVAPTGLSGVGDNPTNPGAHANYLATTAKCGMCHSVHRAAAGGVMLLPTDDATCAGCHTASTAVTAKNVTWANVNTAYTMDGLNGAPGGGGGPHNDGPDTLYEDGYWDGVGTPPAPSYEHGARYGCFTRRCHATNPHGANSSNYKIFAAKLLFNNSPADDSSEYATTTVGSYGGLDAAYDALGATDASVQRFIDQNPTTVRAVGGDIEINKNGTGWRAPDAAETHALVAGLTCGRPSVGDNEIGNDECHAEATYAIFDKAVTEDRNHATGVVGPRGASNPYRTDNTGAEADGWGGNDSRDEKTGHVAGSFEATATHASYAPISGCTSCHDQTDQANTVAGNFTFPHGQTATGATNLFAADGVTSATGLRSRIWSGYAGSILGNKIYSAGTNQKAYDGQCLKCHRDGAGAGIGLTH